MTKGAKESKTGLRPEFFYNFAKESMEKNGYVVLPLEELTEIRNSTHPDNHIIAIKFVAKNSSLLIVKGDYKTISVPTYNVPILGITKQPNFSKIGLEDLGLTVRIDGAKIDAAILMEGEDPQFLERFKQGWKKDSKT